MNPKYPHPPPPKDYPNLSLHQSKSRAKGGKLYPFILLMELVLLVSIMVSFLIIAWRQQQEPSTGPGFTPSHYRSLFRNYKVLIEFHRLPIRTTPIQDAAFEIDNPFIIDIMALEDAASDLVENQEKNANRIADMLLDMESKHQSHPHRYAFILHKKTKLHLKTLYFVKKYDELIARYNTHPHLFDTLELKLFLINSYLRTRNTDKAFEMFKDQFAQESLKAFENYLPRQTLNSFLRRLDFDYWFTKLKYLAKTNQYSEFLRESRYIRNAQLRNLFYAEFNYQQKQYDQCRRYLARVTSENLLAYKERINLKLDLREENTDNLMEKLAVVRTDPEIFLGVLWDAASILLIQGKWEMSLDFYLRYITYTELFQYIHWIRSPILPPLGANYWKALWISAWINYKKNNKHQAAHYFRQGIDSPILSYRIANRYWLQRLDKNIHPPLDLDKYPFTYYYTCNKQPHDPHHAHNSLKTFTPLLNQKQGPNAGNIIADLKELVHYNRLDEAVDFIRWATAEAEGLTVSDRHTLMLIESLLYLRQGNNAMAFIRFRDNFQCYRCIRLPRFLSQIALPVKFTDIIDQYCQEYQLDRELVFALIREESFFRPDAVSPARACGLMQLLLETARQVAYPHRIKVFRRDLFDPEINIRLGTEYLKNLLDKYNGKLPLALAAYNAGWERVDEWMNRLGTVKDDEFIEMIPFSETRNYVKNILRNYFYYRFYYGQ
ncbi:MAG: lytic transglycosylase domain-containing protein [Candidatus Aminicenantes bacterium]|jgi:soluble lytic murein transglycosylase-like protein